MNAASARERSAVQALLQAQNTLTLATCGDDGPWAAAVFFCSDADCNLYFVSDPRSRHGRHLAARPRAAAAVHPEADHWVEIRGLQLEGTVVILDGAARAAAVERYLDKFPRIRRLYARPSGDQERLIAARMRAASLYRLAPERIRMIDNARGFGFKTELRLGGAAE